MYFYGDRKKKNLLLSKFQLIVFKKWDFVLATATVCVKEALKTEYFHDSLKCANITPIYKKWTLLIKRIID